MKAKELELAILRAAAQAGIVVYLEDFQDYDGGSLLFFQYNLSVEWSDKQLPFALIRRFDSDETDGFAGRQEIVGKFEYLEELIEAAFIKMIQIRLEDITSEDLLCLSLRHPDALQAQPAKDGNE